MKKLVLAVIAAMMLCGTLSFAADNKSKDDQNVRSVQGVVNDGDGKFVSGSVVQLKDTKTLSVRSFITKEDGAYHFHGLSPNVDYELKAEYQGASSGTKSLSSFDSRKQAVINLKLESKK
jgi:hypothetical protein